MPDFRPAPRWAGLHAIPAARRPANRAWPAALLVLLTILAYSPAFFAGYIWDDDDYVYENPNLTSRYNLAAVLVETGDYRAAQAHLQSILAADPAFPGARSLLERARGQQPPNTPED